MRALSSLRSAVEALGGRLEPGALGGHLGERALLVRRTPAARRRARAAARRAPRAASASSTRNPSRVAPASWRVRLSSSAALLRVASSAAVRRRDLRLQLGAALLGGVDRGLALVLERLPAGGERVDAGLQLAPLGGQLFARASSARRAAPRARAAVRAASRASRSRAAGARRARARSASASADGARARREIACCSRDRVGRGAAALPPGSRLARARRARRPGACARPRARRCAPRRAGRWRRAAGRRRRARRAPPRAPAVRAAAPPRAPARARAARSAPAARAPARSSAACASVSCVPSGRALGLAGRQRGRGLLERRLGAARAGPARRAAPGAGGRRPPRSRPWPLRRRPAPSAARPACAARGASSATCACSAAASSPRWRAVSSAACSCCSSCWRARGELGDRGGVALRRAARARASAACSCATSRVRRVGRLGRRGQPAAEAVDLLFELRQPLLAARSSASSCSSCAARSCAALRNDCAVTRSAASAARWRSASSSASVRRASSALSAARPRSRFGCGAGRLVLGGARARRRRRRGSSLSASAQTRSDWLSAFSRPSAKPRGVGENSTTTPTGALAWKNGSAAMVRRRGLIATSGRGTNGFSCADSMTLMRRLRRLRSGMSQALTMRRR